MKGSTQSSVVGRLLRRAGLLLTAYLLAEGLAWFGFWIAEGERFSFARMDRDKIALTRPVSGEAPEHATTNLVPHPYVGFVEDPNLPRDPTSVLGQVSAWGFLDDKEPVRPAAADEVVVGVFGGSVAFWFAAQASDVLAAELSRIPAFAGKRFVFVRIALGGFKQPQQLMALNYLLALGGHFDMVLNIDGFNEIALAPNSLVSQHIFPFFPRDWSDLLGQVGDPNRARRIGEITHLERRRATRAAAFMRLPWRRSILANLVWLIQDRGFESELTRAQLAIKEYTPDAARKARMYAGHGPDRSYRNNAEMFSDLAQFWARSSLQMSSVCAGAGIRYFHFLQPNQYVAGSKPMNDREREIAVAPGTFQNCVVAAYPLLRAEGLRLAAQGVAFHDLTQVFRSTPEPLYVDNCCHVSPAGNALLARAIGEAVRVAYSRESPQPGQPEPGGHGAAAAQ